MSTDAPVEVRVGNTAAASAFTAGMAVVLVGLDALMFVGATNSRIAALFRVWFLVLAVLLLAGLAWFGLLLARNPRLVSRTIRVDTEAVTMPARRFGAIPLHDVAGVGLVRLRNPRNGAPAGSWAVAVWRSDASIAYAGGLRRAAQIADPTTSKAAEAARHLHEVVARLQGENGLLRQEEMQRHASFGPYEQFTATWDPVGQGATL